MTKFESSKANIELMELIEWAGPRFSGKSFWRESFILNWSARYRSKLCFGFLGSATQIKWLLCDCESRGLVIERRNCWSGGGEIDTLATSTIFFWVQTDEEINDIYEPRIKLCSVSVSVHLIGWLDWAELNWLLCGGSLAFNEALRKTPMRPSRYSVWSS